MLIDVIDGEIGFIFLVMSCEVVHMVGDYVAIFDLAGSLDGGVLFLEVSVDFE